jgi:hypothetical protein
MRRGEPRFGTGWNGVPDRMTCLDAIPTRFLIHDIDEVLRFLPRSGGREQARWALKELERRLCGELPSIEEFQAEMRATRKEDG